jgi:hypothetical protein
VIKRRRVFYAEGYDPQGAAGYYRLFKQASKSFVKVWPIAIELGQLKLDSDFLAHWDIEASGSDWRVSTRYEFLRLEDIVKSRMSQPLWRQIPRALRWALDDLWSGTTLRIFKASNRFAIHLIGFQLIVMTGVGVSFAAGLLGYILAARFADFPFAAALIVAAASTVAFIKLLQPLAVRWFGLQIGCCWPHLREFGRGEPSAFDPLIDMFAHRIVAAAHANDADEIVVVGHSAGGVFAPAVMARALDLDPGLGRCGPGLVLLTLGSIMPAVAFHPGAAQLRILVQRIMAEPSVVWIDCQSRTDWLNFCGFRCGRRARTPCRSGPTQSDQMARPAPRHADGEILCTPTLESIPSALPVHHGQR